MGPRSDNRGYVSRVEIILVPRFTSFRASGGLAGGQVGAGERRDIALTLLRSLISDTREARRGRKRAKARLSKSMRANPQRDRVFIIRALAGRKPARAGTGRGRNGRRVPGTGDRGAGR